MKRTSLSTILALVVIGAAGATLLQIALAATGRPIVTPPVTLPLALAAIGAIVIALAVPIRRMTRGGGTRSDNGSRPAPPRDVSSRRVPSAVPASRGLPKGPVDPFFATRVVMLAKASALTGAVFTGASAGMLVYLLTRTIVPGVGSVASAVAAMVGAAVLLVCGLVAEHMCRIPPDDDEEGDSQPSRVRL